MNYGICLKCESMKYFTHVPMLHQGHYNDVIMSAMVSQITSLTIVCSTVYSGADQRKHQNIASLAFVQGIHWSPVNSLHKGSVTRKMFPFDDVIMQWSSLDNHACIVFLIFHCCFTLLSPNKPCGPCLLYAVRATQFFLSLSHHILSFVPCWQIIKLGIISN